VSSPLRRVRPSAGESFFRENVRPQVLGRLTSRHAELEPTIQSRDEENYVVKHCLWFRGRVPELKDTLQEQKFTIRVGGSDRMIAVRDIINAAAL
jgi:hypothetical protein